MLYSKFQGRLKEALTKLQENDPQDRLLVIRAIGRLAGSSSVALSDPDVRRHRLPQPFFAVISTSEADIASRRYLVALATPPAASPGEEYFAVASATGKAHPRYPAQVTVQSPIVPGTHIAYIEGEPNTLEVNGLPVSSDPMCIAEEAIDWRT